MTLSNSELMRYSRHLLLPEVGLDGQEKIKSARVLVVGAGGLGSPVVLYLAAAGVGKIGIIDFDKIEVSNLQRQILFSSTQVNQSKARIAALRASDMNPEIRVEPIEGRLSAENALDLLGEFDLVVDGSDNFATRYLVNDACVIARVPYVYGSIYRFEGQASVFATAGGPCYRCLFPVPPPQEAVLNCAEGGVLGVMAGLIGCIQATEALKIITGIGETLAGRLLLYDALSMNFDCLPIKKNLDCPLCGRNPSILRLEESDVTCATEKEINNQMNITSSELEKHLKDGKQITLLDVRTPQEVALCKIQGAIHIPLQELPERVSELDPDRETVAYCKSGVRSMRAQGFLLQSGFKKVLNLEGGIMAWAREIDPSLVVY